MTASSRNTALLKFWYIPFETFWCQLFNPSAILFIYVFFYIILFKHSYPLAKCYVICLCNKYVSKTSCICILSGQQTSSCIYFCQALRISVSKLGVKGGSRKEGGREGRRERITCWFFLLFRCSQALLQIKKKV